MSLRITEHYGTYLINGSLNASMAEFFQKHLEYLLDVHGELTIDLENVTSIDEVGRRALKELFMYSLIYNKSLYVIGESDEELYHNFGYNNVA